MSPEPSVYVLLLWEPRATRRRIGKLGRREFQPGFYAYVGSGGVNVVKRVKRHQRATKPRHWHIDYLTTGPRRMRPVDAYILATPDECGLAQSLADRLSVVRGFGSSDCRCAGHLFHAPDLRSLMQALGPLVRRSRVSG